jgi:hypothetical protein
MRDFRDAKAMAHTMRAALAAKGLNITVSQSPELIVEARPARQTRIESKLLIPHPSIRRSSSGR